MASSWKIDTYRDPEKIDISVLGNALKYKQENYNINTMQTQQLINQYAGTDLLRDVDKEYFGERINTLTNFINQSGTRDWSKKSIANQVQSYVSTALDPNVMSAIASTNAFRKQQSEIDDIKKNKPDQYSMQNEWFATRDIQRYMNSGEIGDSYRAQSYTPYTDVKDIVLKNADKLKDFGMEYHTEDIGGNSYFRRVGTIEKIDPETVKEYLSTIMDTKVMNQLFIDGQYSYKDTPPEKIKEKYQGRLNNYTKAYDERLTELNTKMISATRGDKQKYQNEINKLEASKNELSTYRNQKISNEGMIDYMYRSDFTDNYTGLLSFTRLKDWKMDDSGFQVKKHSDDIALRNRDYDQKVNEFKSGELKWKAEFEQKERLHTATLAAQGKNADGTLDPSNPNSWITATDEVKDQEEEVRANPITVAENRWAQSSADLKEIVGKELKEVLNRPENMNVYGKKLVNANFQNIANLLVNSPGDYTKIYALLSPESKKIVDQAKSDKSRITSIDGNLTSMRNDMISIGKAAMSANTKANTKEMFRKNSYGYTLDTKGNLVKGDVLQGENKFSNVARVVSQVNTMLRFEDVSEDDKTAYKRMLRNTMVESGMSITQMKNVLDKMVYQKSYEGFWDGAGQAAASSLGFVKPVLKVAQKIGNAFNSSKDKFTFGNDFAEYSDKAQMEGNKQGILGVMEDSFTALQVNRNNSTLSNLGGENKFSGEDIDTKNLVDASGIAIDPSSIVTRWSNQLGQAKSTLLKDESTTFMKALNIDTATKPGADARQKLLAQLPVGTDIQKDSSIRISIDKETGIANIVASVKNGKEYVATPFQVKAGELPTSILNSVDMSESQELYSVRNSHSVKFNRQTELPVNQDDWTSNIESLPESERTNAYKNPPTTQQDILTRLDSAYGREIVDTNMEQILKIMDAPTQVSLVADRGQWTTVVKQGSSELMRQPTGLESYSPDLTEKALNSIITTAIEEKIKLVLLNGTRNGRK